ncbi:serine protein kinase PrkA [Geoalkalibacter halelectricus]|uniref:Serine protein kinase PrkA n=1 Tax=Geoalkalibacter halelectricus TaxID=2847045 RepID=A0ABY5ZS66_9BACT|nr:serine protein kinase PrkA [Geoalkalibacter halelectricus]MDO3377536.1 serine protein kinase PrkA [Geoalkalibacter halelectricus]UWZ80705.1 serine protein kinase PrkA [Geoalkalibacter halelectricus]
MNSIEKALQRINLSLNHWGQGEQLSFEEFLQRTAESPQRMVRNIFQQFHDMIRSYLREGYDEYPDDPESIHFRSYDTTRLFVEDTDNPFFADRLFANRLVNLVDALKRGAQQNKIYIFEGPHGCGKSTFLNNLLMKFEKYANTEQGATWETVWRLDRRLLGTFSQQETNQFLDKLSQLLDEYELEQKEGAELKLPAAMPESHVEVPCPSHDHPLLMIPKEGRRLFLDELFAADPEARALLAEKEYDWVFRSAPCTICESLYQALLGKLRNPAQVFRMVQARPIAFNRRVGEGVSVFNPGDKPLKQISLSNEILQNRLNALLRDSNQVRYLYSRFARTNNGIYALMDVKGHNVERLIELHNIISEGVHKVEDIEENVSSLFLALMNPEDKENIKDFQSFSDRIEYIKIPYVLDINTEVEIYRKTFGGQIDEGFLPRVLHNFSRTIISSRMNIRSEAMLEWIGDADKYKIYCDPNLQLLKMEIYTGHIPKWLSEEDRKRLTAKRRRRIIAESETEGTRGFSGRDALKIFNDFHSAYAKEGKLITMANLHKYFRTHKELVEALPHGFLDSLVQMYDYTVLQEVKESLYYYNEEQIGREITNYLFAVNFEPGTTATCNYTGNRLEINEEFFEGSERKLLGPAADFAQRLRFRRAVQKEYTASALTQEIMAEGKTINETTLFRDLFERYVYHLKEKVLDPFLENENFRRAIKDFGGESFRTYDKKIRADVSFLINNLVRKYKYTPTGAREVCMYVIDNDIAKKFSDR